MVYKDYKSGGSVITERLYIDTKQDFKKILKKTTHLMLICLGVIKQTGLLRVVPLQKYP